MFERIIHINLIVADFSRSHRFYTDVLGFEEVKRFEISGPDFAKGVGIRRSRAKVAHLRLRDQDVVLEISEYVEGKSAVDIEQRQANEKGFRHIALRVTDIMSTYDRLMEHGVRFVSPPVTIDRPESLKGFKFCYFYDPDGNIWELSQAAKQV
jgi:catechol 2,3-dioxygenase-like lactoylglutathione lyase family enzyme